MAKPNILGGKPSFNALGGGDALPGDTPVTHGDVNGHLTGIGQRLREQESEQIKANPVTIFQIMPDVKQPRRQVPSVLRPLIGDMRSLFSAWLDAVALEWKMPPKVVDTHVRKILNGEEVQASEVYQSGGQERKAKVMEESLMAVVLLAADIRRVGGLTNPITIAASGDGYVLETGERRWLAYHLLNLIYKGTAWTRIPARKVQAASVWRQASENTAREQLNAIGMARQFAILLMDLIGQDQFQPFDQMVQQGQSDRAYYAQVADGNLWRIPRGKGEQLCTAMGLASADMLRKYRDLLRLPDEVWTTADDLNWPERFIRSEIIEKAYNPQHMVTLTEMQALESGYTVTMVTVWDEDETADTVTAVTVWDEDEAEPSVPENDFPAWEDADMPPALADMLGEPGFTKDALTDAHPAPPDNQDMAQVIANRQADIESQQRQEAEARRIQSRRVNLLKWAHQAGKLATSMWFSGSQAGYDCAFLNELVGARLLESSVRGNTNLQERCYRITPTGSEYVGLTPHDFSQKQAASRPVVDPEEARLREERAAERYEDQLVGKVGEIKDQLLFTIGKFPDAKLKREHQRDVARSTFEDMHKALDDFEDKLLG